MSEQEKDKTEQNPSQGENFNELFTRYEQIKKETNDLSRDFEQLKESLATSQRLIDDLTTEKSKSAIQNKELKNTFRTILKENNALKEDIESLQESCELILSPLINLCQGAEFEMPQSSNAEERRETLENPEAEDCELKQSILPGPISSETATSNSQPATGIISEHHPDQENLEKNDRPTTVKLQDASKALKKTDAHDLEEPKQEDGDENTDDDDFYDNEPSLD